MEVGAWRPRGRRPRPGRWPRPEGPAGPAGPSGASGRRSLVPPERCAVPQGLQGPRCPDEETEAGRAHRLAEVKRSLQGSLRFEQFPRPDGYLLRALGGGGGVLPSVVEGEVIPSLPSHPFPGKTLEFTFLGRVGNDPLAKSLLWFHVPFRK